MKKDLSKQSFFGRLTLNLSFHFNNAECNSILNDYEDWFENEALHGKSEKEICAALEEPKTIVKKLLIESGSSSSRFFILSHNPIIQALLLTVGHLLAVLLLLRISADNYYSFDWIYRAGGILIANLLYFIAGMKMIKKSDDTVKPRNFIKIHLLLFCSAILFIPLVFFLVCLSKNPAFYGPAYVNTFSVVIFTGYAANICLTIHKILQNRQLTQFTFSMLLHISGMISAMAFLIGQHNYSYSWSEFFISGACATLFIYTEIFVLCLFCLKKAHIQGSE